MNTVPWYQDPQWWAIIAALLLGVLGIFQDWIRSLFKKPRLKVSFTLNPPESHKIPFSNQKTGQKLYDSYYFRIKIANSGKYKMEDVEVMAVELFKKADNGNYKKAENFLPLNLLWSHYQIITMPNIQPGLFKHLALGHIIESKNAELEKFGLISLSDAVLLLDTAIRPNSGTHVLLPGDYNIKLKITANNLKVQSKIFNIVFDGHWEEEIDDMFSRRVSIKEVKSIN